MAYQLGNGGRGWGNWGQGPGQVPNQQPFGGAAMGGTMQPGYNPNQSFGNANQGGQSSIGNGLLQAPGMGGQPQQPMGGGAGQQWAAQNPQTMNGSGAMPPNM